MLAAGILLSTQRANLCRAGSLIGTFTFSLGHAVAVGCEACSHRGTMRPMIIAQNSTHKRPVQLSENGSIDPGSSGISILAARVPQPPGQSHGVLNEAEAFH